MHTELGAGRGLGAAALTQGLGLPDGEGEVGFGGLERRKTGSGGKQWRGHWKQWWCFVWAWWVKRDPLGGMSQRVPPL